MLVMSSTGSATVVREGIYEITDTVSGQYLNSIQANVYNRFCDDALILQDQPTRLGKARLIIPVLVLLGGLTSCTVGNQKCRPGIHNQTSDKRVVLRTYRG